MSIHNDACITTATNGKVERHEAHDFTRKRKREDDLQCAIDRRPFTIQTDSTDPFAKPRTFTPLCLLSRSNLPLAYLDTAQCGSRMFAAHVQILEACHDFQDETNLLVVEDEGEARLYAIERVQRRRYALCRLGAWVKTGDVEQRSNMDVRPDQAPRKRHALKLENSGQPWWMSVAVEEKTEDIHSDSVRGCLPALSMQRPRSAVAAGQSLVMPDDPALLPHSLDTAEPDILKIPIPAEALEELTKHYLDALYLSRTPLAYFTKGPLARARAAFASSPAELVTFLRGSILSSSVMDKKYREVIAEHVKEMPSFDAEASATKPKSKRKRKWKAKRDKSGFFVDEKDHVEQWWQKDDDSGGSPNAADSTDAVLKRRSPRLRNRETFMQIILILEILALEAGIPSTELSTANESQDADSQAQESQAAGEKKPRKKKEVDLPAVLESLIDRLCIWYSLETTTPIKPGANGSGDSKDETSDDLKSFCTEVILPFYGGRVADQANSTSKKLGGPSVPKPASQRVSAASRKPGEPAERRAPEKKPRKPLGRVSTDTLNSIGTRPPLLHRSATDSAALSPLIKQEEVELPSLDRIPLARPRSQPQVPAFPKPRASLLQQVSFNKREVDLSAMSQANEEKKRKKAKVQEQIKDAIGTLRKPNRALAVVEVAKNADESFAKAIARGKTTSSTNHSQRRPTAQTSVAVTATPRHIKATPMPRRRTNRGSDEKSTQLVPASSTRLFAGRSSDVVPSSSFAIPQTAQKTAHRTAGPSIEETPSRGFAKFMPAALARPPGTLLESPTVRRTAAPISETPSRPLRMPGLMETPKVRQPVGLRRVEASPAQVMASPIVGRDAGSGLGSGGKSIYGALGWDEEEYEELS
ncbi:unnamed protein product [Zymoseptoria tritici ST99CH_1A5]|uniref:DNA replication regulator Sld3 C-terminal domain-containing protein n=3 Tax=Zymoseptoria tritici TaxID=1047171 RepID=F9WYK2_ZYMTI|nr:uncharacterized protein MYCGRDRAFT_90108 [Zymoseptoria tritici IPO323]EGP91941.1 hypothetical protein MYCGRDRAFT_90108 [Zymoseptoria tritici IPO323]SMQ46795.1 unnamed protein product [Zymoseptoria tritici ST99CH_3D7]SMY20478.1 unnamed protein product [Zymoseptoria tritici ST99CH_1A5]